MMQSVFSKIGCTFLAGLLSLPAASAQVPKPPVSQSAQAAGGGPALAITILEGNNAVNSLPLLRSNAPVVEVHDQNEFPVEGATVIFTLPSGPGGTFPGGQTTFSTRSDAHGQAAAPFFTPAMTGKFQIKVTAASGTRTGEASIVQTNSAGEYSGPPLPAKPVYKKKLPILLIGGGVAAAIVLAILVTRKSNSASSASAPNTVTITPGSPIFH